MTRPTADSFDRLLARARDYLSTEIDARDSEELSALIDAAETHDEALADLSSRFEGPLRFGTAGIRGLVGAGESRMNRVLVRRVSYGLATYLIATNPKALSRGIVLARDARNRSQSFQEEAAGVFAACGLPVWFLDGPQPTPLAAFAIKHVGAAAGVVITASHNPREYNGYKAYWENGAQIVPPTDALIATRFDEAPPAASIPTLAFDELGGQLRPVPDLAAAYLDALPPLQSSLTERSRLSVAYSALHGVGYEMFSRAIEKSGAALHSVEEQERPDPDFPTVTFPNPEEPGVSDRLIALAREEHADVAMINDPDADRLAIAVPSDEAPSGFRSLSGNELGILLAHHLLSFKSSATPKPLVVTTVVSTRMLSRLAARRDAAYLETLTGFKWIATQAIEAERGSGVRFLFGFEEAIGYSVETSVRDKDGISAGYVAADMLALAKSRNDDPLDVLEQIYAEIGHHVANQRSVVLEGAAGQRRMREALDKLRQRPPLEIGQERVNAVWDLKGGTYRLSDGSRGVPAGCDDPAAMPADVLIFDMEDGGRCAVRPSGTEPKIKFYIEVVETLASDSEERAHQRIERMLEELIRLAGI